jgi:23S rRNA (pseudouridine1915-N3)-methyltransferase
LRVTILSVGHRMPGWIRDGFEEYARRMPREIRVELIVLKPGADLLAAVPRDATLIALDEHGKSLSTKGLATLLSQWMRDACHPVFAIGGADGLPETVKARAAKVISLSALTLPHHLVRVLLAEQLYRAWSILAGHPYHRE